MNLIWKNWLIVLLIPVLSSAQSSYEKVHQIMTAFSDLDRKISQTRQEIMNDVASENALDDLRILDFYDTECSQWMERIGYYQIILHLNSTCQSTDRNTSFVVEAQKKMMINRTANSLKILEERLLEGLDQTSTNAVLNHRARFKSLLRGIRSQIRNIPIDKFVIPDKILEEIRGIVNDLNKD